MNLHGLVILKLMKWGTHAAGCLGIPGICEPIANSCFHKFVFVSEWVAQESM